MTGSVVRGFTLALLLGSSFGAIAPAQGASPALCTLKFKRTDYPTGTNPQSIPPLCSGQLLEKLMSKDIDISATIFDSNLNHSVSKPPNIPK